MKIALTFLVLTVLIAWPAVSPAQTSAPAESKGGAGQEIKDSWITSKTKTALVTDGRVKARRIKVETQGGVVTLRGKVGSGEERNAAEEITKRIDGVRSVPIGALPRRRRRRSRRAAPGRRSRTPGSPPRPRRRS